MGLGGPFFFTCEFIFPCTPHEADAGRCARENISGPGANPNISVCFTFDLYQAQKNFLPPRFFPWAKASGIDNSNAHKTSVQPARNRQHTLQGKGAIEMHVMYHFACERAEFLLPLFAIATESSL